MRCTSTNGIRKGQSWGAAFSEEFHFYPLELILFLVQPTRIKRFSLVITPVELFSLCHRFLKMASILQLAKNFLCIVRQSSLNMCLLIVHHLKETPYYRFVVPIFKILHIQSAGSNMWSEFLSCCPIVSPFQQPHAQRINYVTKSHFCRYCGNECPHCFHWDNEFRICDWFRYFLRTPGTRLYQKLRKNTVNPLVWWQTNKNTPPRHCVSDFNPVIWCVDVLI